MPNKVLFCATVDYHFSSFHLPVLEWFKKRGWEVHVAAKGEIDIPFVDMKYNIPIERSPLSSANMRAYRQLKTIIREHQYDLVHCHTPMGGVIARLAARSARKEGTKVIYTAHGFHFCKGAPLQNWLLYYPIEKGLARMTDCLITINSEDYNLAKHRKFKARKIAHVHGVGIDSNRYRPVSPMDKTLLRQRSSYQAEDFLMFYAAEFNANKNHQLLITAMAKIKNQVPTMRLLLAGRGMLQESCRELSARLGVEHMIDFLGYREDIPQLLPMCDIAVSGSLREGLPVNIMEAMACGLPIVATRNRGHLELIEDGKNGFLIDPQSADQFASQILKLAGSAELRREMGEKSLKHIKKYTLKQVERDLNGIYTSYMEQPTYEAERLQWRTP